MEIFSVHTVAKHIQLLKRFKKIKGDALRFVFRNFPLSEVHSYALHAAYAAEAAGKQHKFWRCLTSFLRIKRI